MNEEEDPFKGSEDDDVEDPVQALGADLSILKERFADQIDAEISLDKYVNFGIEVSTLNSKLANAEIITEAQEDNSDGEKSGYVEGKTIIKLGIEEVQKAIEILKISASIKSSEPMMRSLKKYYFIVEKEYVFNKKLALILYFFLKQ